MSRRTAELWTCEHCGRAFANRNQSHACGRWTLDRHFAGKSPTVREIFDSFLAMIERFGPVRVLPEKTRIAFQVRMSFAQLTVRRSWALGLPGRRSASQGTDGSRPRPPGRRASQPPRLPSVSAISLRLLARP